MDEFFKKLLDDREIRAQRQKDLIRAQNRPIISYMLNTPGLEKKNQKLLDFHNYGFGQIKKYFKEKIIAYDYYPNETGMYYLISLDMDPVDIKKLTVEIEEKEPGARLLDIDVFDIDHKQISRTDLGLEPRKCLVCGDVAKTCIVGKKHDYSELIKAMYSIINQVLERK